MLSKATWSIQADELVARLCRSHSLLWASQRGGRDAKGGIHLHSLGVEWLEPRRGQTLHYPIEGHHPFLDGKKRGDIGLATTAGFGDSSTLCVPLQKTRPQLQGPGRFN